MDEKRDKLNAKTFKSFWFVSTIVFPWALFAMEIMVFNLRIGSLLFNIVFYLFGFLSFRSFFYFFNKHKKVQIGSFRRFILKYHSKVFWGGIILGYIGAFLVSYISWFLTFIYLLFTTIVLPVEIIFYNIGKKNFKKENLVS